MKSSVFFLLCLFTFIAVAAAKGTRTHLSGQGSPLPYHKNHEDYAAHHEVSKWESVEGHGDVIHAKREEVITTIATRTHHRGRGSPVPKSRGSPLPSVKVNDWQIAYEVYEILEEYDDGVVKTSSKTVELSTTTSGTLIKRAPATDTTLPRSPTTWVHDTTSSGGEHISDTKASDTSAMKHELPSAHSNFGARSQTLPNTVTGTMSEPFHTKDLDHFPEAVQYSPPPQAKLVSTKKHEAVQGDKVSKLVQA